MGDTNKQLREETESLNSMIHDVVTYLELDGYQALILCTSLACQLWIDEHGESGLVRVLGEYYAKLKDLYPLGSSLPNETHPPAQVSERFLSLIQGISDKCELENYTLFRSLAWIGAQSAIWIGYSLDKYLELVNSYLKHLISMKIPPIPRDAPIEERLKVGREMLDDEMMDMYRSLGKALTAVGVGTNKMVEYSTTMCVMSAIHAGMNKAATLDMCCQFFDMAISHPKTNNPA